MEDKRIKEIYEFLGFDGRHLGTTLEIVMETQKVGITYLMRQFSAKHGMKIGYNKASGLIDRLELIGAVSPRDPKNGTRVVLWKCPEE